MRKLVIAALAVTSFFAAASAAHAGWWDIYGVYHPTCVFWPYYGWVCG